MTTSQLRAVHFHDHRTTTSAARVCRRVLQRLTDLQLVELLGRRVGGWQSGSDAGIWRIGLAGDRLLRSRDDAPRPRFKQPSPRFLDHRLTVADCYAMLISAQHEGGPEVLQADPEPNSWRTFLGAGGVPEILKPDLYAVTASGEYEDHWFCEIDRATESVPTVLKKCQQYARYRRSGIEQQRIGLFPLVVWVVPDEKRVLQLTNGIRRSRDLDADLFRTTSTDDFQRLVAGGAS